MAKQYLTVNGQLVMHNGKLIQVPDLDGINDLLDEQDGYATQLKQLSDDVSNLALNGLVDGTPRGSFQTLEQLQTAYPDGTPGIYVITKTGEWCYYNEGWKIGGNYIEPDSGGGASITANIKITGNKDDILGTTEHNKLCILSDTGDLSFKVVDKIEGGSEELSTLSEVLPQKLSSACCSRYGNNIYIFGGYNGSSKVNTIYKFNCQTKTIETLSATLPKVLSNACCSTYGDNIYIFGGSSTSYTNAIYKFNCTTETIETLSATSPQQIMNACCSTSGDIIYIFGGSTGSTYLNTIYKFNCITETISTLSITLPHMLSSACCSTYGDNMYIFGGYYYNGSHYYLNTIYKFNCTTETISKLSATLPQVLSSAHCSINGDNIYIFGGKNGSTALNTIYKFNCTNETIITISTTLSIITYDACCSVYGDNIYIFGGGNTSYLNTIYNFSITFELTTNNVLIYNANSKYSFDLITNQVTIPINKVYIGNSNNTAELANAYLYDESQTAWVNVNTGEVLS